MLIKKDGTRIRTNIICYDIIDHMFDGKDFNQVWKEISEQAANEMIERI